MDIVFARWIEGLLKQLNDALQTSVDKLGIVNLFGRLALVEDKVAESVQCNLRCTPRGLPTSFQGVSREDTVAKPSLSSAAPAYDSVLVNIVSDGTDLD